MISFNWRVYKELNIDLRRKGLKNQQEYEDHYKTYSAENKRPAFVTDVYPDFTAASYAQCNPDLNITSTAELEEHWILYGRKEGRRYKAESWIPSFHVLIATMGRRSIMHLLRTLINQLQENDYLTVVFDGAERAMFQEMVHNFTRNFKCKVDIIIEKEPLGYWGHGIRNKHNKLPGDFILHADDDDFYLPEVFAKLREICNDPTTIYIFQFETRKAGIIFSDVFRIGSIGTPSGIIPSKYNAECKWGHMRGGDGQFYIELSHKYGSKFVFVPLLIYTTHHLSNRIFNWERYRELNPDLKFISKDEYVKHWNEKGFPEGRPIC